MFTKKNYSVHFFLRCKNEPKKSRRPKEITCQPNGLAMYRSLSKFYASCFASHLHFFTLYFCVPPYKSKWYLHL